MYSNRSSSDTAEEHAPLHTLPHLSRPLSLPGQNAAPTCAHTHTQSRGVPHTPGGGATGCRHETVVVAQVKELVGGSVVSSGRSSSNTVSRGLSKCTLEPGSEERTAWPMLHSKGTDGAPADKVCMYRSVHLTLTVKRMVQGEVERICVSGGEMAVQVTSQPACTGLSCVVANLLSAAICLHW